MDISQVGTFDLENYGDLLYPIILSRLLKSRQPKPELRHYSLIGGSAPHEASFRTDPVNALLASGEPSRIVVGGGDLLRIDSDVIAAHYGASYGRHFKTVRNAIGTSASIGYLMRKSVPHLNEMSYFVKQFKRRRVNQEPLGPFIIDPASLPPGSAVAYLSCGVPADFPPKVREHIAKVFDRANFIYLRDEQSAEKLRRAGVRREIHVAPDLVVTLSMCFDYQTELRKGREILSRYGVNRDRPLLCFQSKPYPEFREEVIVEQLNYHRLRTGSEVVLLPLGYCHHDRAFLQRLAQYSPGTLKYVDVYSIFDMISVIAASDIFVGTSLHGNITAFSFGIPHLFGPLPVDKNEGFLHAVNLPDQLKLRSWAKMNDQIEFAQTLGHQVFSERVQKAQAKALHAVHALVEGLLP